MCGQTAGGQLLLKGITTIVHSAISWDVCFPLELDMYSP